MRKIGRQKDRVALWLKKDGGSICMTVNNKCIVWAELDKVWWTYNKEKQSCGLEKSWRFTYKHYDFVGYIK